MDKKLLSILCCPVTHKGLALARADQLRAINAAIDAGGLQNRDGQELKTPLSEALITEDGKTMYPVDDGIPVLLESESVSMSEIG